MSDQTIEQQTEQFMDQLGEPALQFTAPTDAVSIPKGLLDCCRVSHQASCAHHVAHSLVGAVTVMMDLMTGAEIEAIHPRPISVAGDVLADPTALFAATRAHWVISEATARTRLAEIKSMQVAVFLLTPEQTMAWRRLEGRIQEHADSLAVNLSETDRINMMPFGVIPDPANFDGEEVEEINEAIASLKTVEDWRDVTSYSSEVLTWPNEIGCGNGVRYVIGEVTQPTTEGIPWMGDPNDPMTRLIADGVAVTAGAGEPRL